jgi:hypothetical protein
MNLDQMEKIMKKTKEIEQLIKSDPQYTSTLQEKWIEFYTQVDEKLRYAIVDAYQKGKIRKLP